MKNIRLEIHEHIATIYLERPPVNALSLQMIEELIAALRMIDDDDAVRVGILTGSGRCFSAGVDLKEQLAAVESGGVGPAALGPQLYDALLNGRKPLIAAINGPALGAGLSIAASCCILVASDTAEVGLPEINVGVLGGARHAMRLFGHSTVNRMLLTGYRLDARELLARRVVEACVPAAELLDAARAIAREIADKDPSAVALARQCLAEVETLTVLDGYKHESRLSEELGRTAAAQALMRGFVERR